MKGVVASPSRASRVGASARRETMRPCDEALRVLYVTLEFSAGAFSGNGVYAQSQARALGRAGHRVLVVCGTPDTPDSASTPDHLVSVVALPVPSSKWGCLDVHSPWREFADAAGSSPDLVSAVRAFDPNVVLGVDWSSLPAWNALRAALEPPTDRTSVPFLPPPFVYANFRVFSRTDPAHESLESDAVAAAAAVVALCDEDADHLARRLAPPRVALAPRVILPPLRDDIRTLALATDPTPQDAAPNDASTATRRYLTCVSRLSPEKEPERFVALAEALERRGALRPDGIVPLLCASTPGAYADTVRDRFHAVASRVGGICERRFLDADALARVYRGAYLNVHPCARDAYGMTVVEAAAFGTPSVSQRGSAVGCSALLREEAGERVAANVEDVEAFADVVERALRDVEGTRAVGERARARALAWDETANANAVAEVLREAMDANRRDERVTSWTLPAAEDVARLAPPWRAAAICLRVGGEWTCVQAEENAGTTRSAENDPRWRLGARAGAEILVVTAHNPMGASRAPEANDAAHAKLLRDVRETRPAPAAAYPAASIDAVGGAEVWCEIGVGIELPEDPEEAAETARAVRETARKHGQAATYALRCDEDGWTLAVRPCWDGLEGLACENVRLVTREVPNKSMPPDPEGDDVVFR